MIPYCILGLFGYLSTLEDTPKIIIMRDLPSTLDNDWLMVIARILMAFTLVLAVPINLPPCRNSIQRLVFKVKGRAPFKIHAGISISILIVTLIIGLFYPNILVLFNILGGVCATSIVLVIPSLLRIELSGKPKTHWQNVIILILVVFLSICGLISVALSF